MTKIRERVREKLVKAQLIPEVWLGGANEYNLISKICEIFGEELSSLEGEVEELPNVCVKTIQGNKEVEVELKAKFTKGILDIIRQHKER